MSEPAISIAMCTYNGAKHVLRQLESFAAQTLLPRELVVCDDVSKDETVAVVREFAARAPFEVRLEVNESNLGFRRNFMKAVGLTRFELVLFSDQDDVWHPEKLRKFAGAYRRVPEPGLIFCDANLVDDELKPLGTTLWKTAKFGPAAQRRVEGVSGAAILVKDPTWFIFGATMGFAAKYKPLLFPMPETWGHDPWVASVVAAVAPVALIDEPLNDYRQHANQLYGGVPPSLGHLMNSAKDRATLQDHFRETVERYQTLADRLRERGATTLDPALFGRIAAKVEHWQARSDMRKVSKLARFPIIGREFLTGRYRSCSKGWRSMAHDIVY